MAEGGPVGLGKENKGVGGGGGGVEERKGED